ncbi:hypothetical protein, partial [Zymomonas sp.]|uniref:hypothetical protein n=1 Tax=Zymomonas sp. TaxID=2068624 RepID=UPI0025CDBC85
MINKNQIEEIYKILQKINKIGIENDTNKKWYIKYEKFTFYITMIIIPIAFLIIVLNEKLSLFDKRYSVIIFISSALFCMINYALIILIQIYFS